MHVVLTSLTNGDVSCKDILFQTPCNAPVASKVILSLDCDMQNSASCFNQSSIRQFPANLRRWKPLERRAQLDRFLNGCIKTCGTQTRILVRRWILKESKKPLSNTFFRKSSLTFCLNVPLDVLQFSFKYTMNNFSSS